VTSYPYNGLGDRLSQNRVNYTLDLNAGLTQVLSDSENTYTYGIGRISQQNRAATEYFLGDALGSVRQLVDAAGQITLVKSYEPYGSVVSSVGSGASAYGFTGEQQDVSGLVYLRARYYAPWDGRFVSRDVWEGVSTRPVSYHRWVYVSANPVNAVDPSGLYDGKKVHYQVTYDLAMAVTKLYPRPGSQFLPRLIATWDEYVDKGPTLNPVVGCVACHFMPLELAASRVEKVIFSGEPYLFGAALHQLQDSFSHWSEGYHDQTWGHAYHSVLAEMRDEDDLATFFANKPKASVIAEILDRNPGMTWETVLLKDDWEVVDLYLTQLLCNQKRFVEKRH